MSAVVLNVEDSFDDVLLLKRACQRAKVGFNLHVAEDGEVAVEYLTGQGQFADRQKYPWPDLILLDLKMPRKGGFEVLEWLKTNHECRRIPVAVFTSSTNTQDIDGAMNHGADCYIAKPLKYEALVSVISVIDAALREKQEPVCTALAKLPECCASGPRTKIQ